MRRFDLILLLIFACFQNSFASEILATVGKTVITDHEVTKRAKLMLLLQNQKYDDHTVQLVQNEVLGHMINEAMRKMYAESISLVVESSEVESTIKELQKERKIDSKVMEMKLASAGIQSRVLYDMVYNEILWREIVKSVIAPQIRVLDNEVMQIAKSKNVPFDPKNVHESKEIMAIRNEIFMRKLDARAREFTSQMRKFYFVDLMK